MRERLKKGLPTVDSWNQAWSGRKGKQVQKTLNNLKVTIICGFVTILVLRGTMGGTSFYGPTTTQDENLASSRETRRILAAQKLDEEEEDPVVDPNVPYSIGPKIKDWNEQRALWLSENPHIGAKTANGKDRFLLVTGSQPQICENAVGDHYLLKSIKNKVDYCRLHDIEIFYNMAHLDKEMAGFWSKLPLIRKLMLAHPESEWIWWMDSDAMFTDMVFEIPIDRYKDHNLVVHGFKEKVYQNKSWVGLNTGSFLMRNCQWSLDLLDAWAPMGPKGPARMEAGKLLTQSLAGRPKFEADDQSALIYLLITQKELWASKVYLEESYYLHGYWMIIVDKYEELMKNYHPGYGDDRWPFVTHFVGCKPCNKVGDYPAEQCMKQMERAFNFADNQILQLYGFQHQSLGTGKVKRIWNDTADPLHLLHP